MDQSKTHYQVSFTVRQALALFVGLLLSLAGAYFLGVMTGLSGRGSAGANASARSEETSAAASGTPLPEFPAATRAESGAAVEPTPPAKVQLFDDRPGSEIQPTPAERSATPSHLASPFWVQVVSVRSEREARARSRKLSSRGYHVTVETVPGPKGKLYRVRVGPYRTREEASQAADRLSRSEKVKAWIVPAGK